MGSNKDFNKYDIVGTEINGIKVLSYSHLKVTEKGSRLHYYNCKCFCNNVKKILRYLLVNGKIKSCGCYIYNKTHGETGSPLYRKWASMKERILNKNNAKMKNYGGRGILIDERWLFYENFKNDMEESFNKHVEEFGLKETTIDRINVNGNYCKMNCRWATNMTQSRNKTDTLYITYKNEEKPLIDWCEMLNINYKNTWDRIKRGDSPEKAFEKPVRELKHKRLTQDLVVKIREMLSMGYQNKQIAELLDVSANVVSNIKNNKFYKHI